MAMILNLTRHSCKREQEMNEQPLGITLLPDDILRKILSWTGLHRRCPIVLDCDRTRDRTRDCETKPEYGIYGTLSGDEGDECLRWLNRNVKRDVYGHYFPIKDRCVCPALPVAILRTNKQFNKLGMDVLYRDNRFAATCNEDVLKCFTKLCTRGMKMIRRLELVLQSPDDNSNEISSNREASSFLDNKKQRHYVHKDQNSVKVWAKLISYIGPLLTPGQLELRVRIHTTKTYEEILIEKSQHQVQKYIIEPMKRLPYLAHLSILLWPDIYLKDYHVFEEIRLSILQIAKCLTDQTESFPFIRLPVELQQRILEYTDIVRHESIPYKPNYKALDRSFCLCCPLCMNYRCAQAPRWRELVGNPGLLVSTACTCKHDHTTLFHISKSMNILASHVFWSCNTFSLISTQRQDLSTVLCKLQSLRPELASIKLILVILPRDINKPKSIERVFETLAASGLLRKLDLRLLPSYCRCLTGSPFHADCLKLTEVVADCMKLLSIPLSGMIEVSHNPYPYKVGEHNHIRVWNLGTSEIH